MVTPWRSKCADEKQLAKQLQSHAGNALELTAMHEGLRVCKRSASSVLVRVSGHMIRLRSALTCPNAFLGL